MDDNFLEGLEKSVTYEGRKYKVIYYTGQNHWYLSICTTYRKYGSLNTTIEQLFTRSRDWLKKYITVPEYDPNYLIEEVIVLFKLYQEELDEAEQKRRQKLVFDEWDGEINFEK